MWRFYGRSYKLLDVIITGRCYQDRFRSTEVQINPHQYAEFNAANLLRGILIAIISHYSTIKGLNKLNVIYRILSIICLIQCETRTKEGVGGKFHKQLRSKLPLLVPRLLVHLSKQGPGVVNTGCSGGKGFEWNCLGGRFAWVNRTGGISPEWNLAQPLHW